MTVLEIHPVPATREEALAVQPELEHFVSPSSRGGGKPELNYTVRETRLQEIENTKKDFAVEGACPCLQSFSGSTAFLNIGEGIVRTGKCLILVAGILVAGLFGYGWHDVQGGK